MNVKGAVFDFDGTLFDSMQIWENVGKDYLQSIGKEPKECLREELRTMSLKQSAEYLKKEYDIEQTVEEIRDEINHIIEDYYYYEVLPKNGIIDLLDRLQKEQVMMCIATATDRYLIEAALKRCKIEHYFTQIFTCSEVGHGKDNPMIFRYAMEELKLERSNMIIFEDAYHAIVTAKEDGFFVVGVADTYEARQKEIAQMSNCYISSFEDINKCWNKNNAERREDDEQSIINRWQ